jgi:hypothetical protein
VSEALGARVVETLFGRLLDLPIARAASDNAGAAVMMGRSGVSAADVPIRGESCFNRRIVWSP